MKEGWRPIVQVDLMLILQIRETRVKWSSIILQLESYADGPKPQFSLGLLHQDSGTSQAWNKKGCRDHPLWELASVTLLRLKRPLASSWLFWHPPKRATRSLSGDRRQENIQGRLKSGMWPWLPQVQSPLSFWRAGVGSLLTHPIQNPEHCERLPGTSSALLRPWAGRSPLQGWDKRELSSPPSLT